MFIATWLWYLLLFSIVISVALQGHSVYTVHLARSAKTGVNASIVGRIVFNLLVSLSLNAATVYLVMNGGKF